jgi:trk system potassium uptake protein
MELKKISPVLTGFKLILSYMGIFLMIIGIIMILPLLSLFFYPEEINLIRYFLIPGVVLFLIGFISYRILKRFEKQRLARHQDAVLVVMAWIEAIILSSIPFLLFGYSFTHSMFETTSGFSTTGLSIVDVTEAPKMLLLYRSILQLFGGLGFVLVLTSAISDKLGMRLYQAEGHVDQLVPNLLRSGKLILRIYLFYIALGVIAYVIFGMPLFDALNHSISAVATGGFSVQPSSIGFYNSFSIEVITMVLMILGGTNFFVHLLLFRRQFKEAIAHVEVKVFAIITIFSIMLSTVSMMIYQGFDEPLRQSAFQLISAITGTGYQTISDFTLLPSLSFFLIILTMVLGAGMNSTAGGMKQFRIGLMVKSQYWQIQEMLGHKKTIRTHFINRLGKLNVVEKEDIAQNYMFITTYMTILLIGTMILMTYNYSFEHSLFEFASALGTVGLSVGIMNASAPPLILWTGTIGMFLGRLEFYVIFIAISKMLLDLLKKKVV